MRSKLHKQLHEIALQAGGSFFPEVNPQHQNRFAELLIRQCMEINRQELSFAAYAALCEKYYEHFGVTLDESQNRNESE